MNSSRAVYVDRNIILQPPFRHKLQEGGKEGGTEGGRLKEREKKKKICTVQRSKGKGKVHRRRGQESPEGEQTIALLFL